MDEQDAALHEIADARARMSELADELARHANPEHVKALAREKASEWTERARELASDKAVELKDQAKEALAEKASELKTHAKEAVMQTTMEVKDRVDTPRGWSLLGALIGAGVGAVLMKKAFTVREKRHGLSAGRIPREGFQYRGETYPTAAVPGAYPGSSAAGMSGDISAMGSGADTGLSSMGMRTDVENVTGAGLKERASDMTQSVKDKASELKDRAVGAMDQIRDGTVHMRERIPSGTELKGRTTEWFHRAVEGQPLMLALGSIALGVFASMLLPVSQRERRLIEPAKRKAQESLSQLGEQLEQKLQDTQGATGPEMSHDATGGMGVRTESMSHSMGTSERSEELMGAERPDLMGTDRAESLASPTGSRIPPMPPLDDVSTKIH